MIDLNANKKKHLRTILPPLSSQRENCLQEGEREGARDISRIRYELNFIPKEKKKHIGKISEINFPLL